MPNNSATIYARISNDTKGLAEGVKRQIADCGLLLSDLVGPSLTSMPTTTSLRTPDWTDPSMSPCCPTLRTA